ncbi:hypothetical protein R50912_33770 [Paenibacillus sp. FSL R5-0912]|nr:hypothetical protein R50912_33770 [Paenibacillus sp. FSL R5-0912]
MKIAVFRASRFKLGGLTDIHVSGNLITSSGKANITGAPFFVIDRKFAISGAQPTEVRQTVNSQAVQAK